MLVSQDKTSPPPRICHQDLLSIHDFVCVCVCVCVGGGGGGVVKRNDIRSLEHPKYASPVHHVGGI